MRAFGRAQADQYDTEKGLNTTQRTPRIRALRPQTKKVPVAARH
jgi:hypothetical protein